MNEYDLSWIDQKPKMGYHNGIGKPVFLNREAFWLCYSGSAHPEVVDLVEWEWDDSFKDYFIKEIDSEINQINVKSHLKELVKEASDEQENLKQDESIKVFITEDSETPISNLSQFNSKDSREEIQKFIKAETKEHFMDNFKETVKTEQKRVKENPIERDEHGALVLPDDEET